MKPNSLANDTKVVKIKLTMLRVCFTRIITYKINRIRYDKYLSYRTSFLLYTFDK